MPVTAQTLSDFRADLGAIRCYEDPRQLEARSKDYYWYSPILSQQLDGKCAQLLVVPETEAEVMTTASAAARHGVPLTIRGGGTGNYGQCVPLDGGVVLDMTRLNKVHEIREGRVICDAGIRIAALEQAVAETGQMLTMFPSTKRHATLGGFIAGGSGGIGSLRHGVLRDDGNVSYIRLVTVEETPRIIELHGSDIQKVQHAYGTNGIITRLDFALCPMRDWQHVIALFDGYADALRFALAAQEMGLDCYLLTVVERRMARFYKRLADAFPSDQDGVFAMVAPDAMPGFEALVAQYGGRISQCKTLPLLEADNQPPVWECGWNHTTLQALKHEPGVWSYLQVAYPRPFDPDLVLRQMARYGDEVLMHHEMARMGGEVQIFAIPLVRWTNAARMYGIIAEFESLDGCTIYDPHVVTIEEGGMKDIDTVQIDFKRRADPYGLMNPGKTTGWTPDMARTKG